VFELSIQIFDSGGRASKALGGAASGESALLDAVLYPQKPSKHQPSYKGELEQDARDEFTLILS